MKDETRHENGKKHALKPEANSDESPNERTLVVPWGEASRLVTTSTSPPYTWLALKCGANN